MPMQHNLTLINLGFGDSNHLVWLFIAGLILMVSAGASYYFAQRHEQRIAAIDKSKSFDVKSLNKLYQEMTDRGAVEEMEQPCQLYGVAVTDDPLLSPVSKTKCVAYNYKIEREIQEKHYLNRNDFDDEYEVVTYRETVFEEDKRVSFWLRDTTGRVWVSADTAELELLKGVEKLDFNRPLNLEVDTPLFSFRDAKITGYFHSERLIPVLHPITVLGCAIHRGWQLAVAENPQEENQHFIISTRTGKELKRLANLKAMLLYGATALLGISGVVFLTLWVV